MKKLLSIIVLGLLWCSVSYSEEIFLSCTHETGSSIVISFDNEKKVGKEYIGGDSQISYDLIMSEGIIYFASINRSWNIDRYTGISTLSNKNADGTFLNVKWVCNPAKKKF